MPFKDLDKGFGPDVLPLDRDDMAKEFLKGKGKSEACRKDTRYVSKSFSPPTPGTILSC